MTPVQSDLGTHDAIQSPRYGDWRIHEISSFPGILVKDCPNPFDLPYRLVDGKHRVERAIAQGQTKSLFNVITYNRVKLELKPALTKWEEQNHDSR